VIIDCDRQELNYVVDGIYIKAFKNVPRGMRLAVSCVFGKARIGMRHVGGMKGTMSPVSLMHQARFIIRHTLREDTVAELNLPKTLKTFLYEAIV
jgi:hypothetical protein